MVVDQRVLVVKLATIKEMIARIEVAVFIELFVGFLWV
jgi:hypothetical protein